MKESGKMTKSMAKVRKKRFVEWYMDSNIFNAFKGKKISKYGDFYEGEWKDGKQNGQGTKNDLLTQPLFNFVITRQENLEVWGQI